MIGRIVGMDSTDGQTLRIAYDSKNRTDYVVSKVGDSSTKPGISTEIPVPIKKPG